MEEIKKSSSQVKDTGDGFDIKYQGTVIPIKNEKLKLSLIKINEITTKIENEQDLTKKINTFSDIFNIIEDIIKIIKKEKVEDQSDSKIILFILT